MPRTSCEADRFDEIENVHVKGDRSADKQTPLDRVHIADRVTYGLINLRTDGKTIRASQSFILRNMLHPNWLKWTVADFFFGS